MNKTFLLNTDLRSARFLAAPPSAKGYWIVLQCYCSDRANGGVIEGARSFSSKQWSALLGASGGLAAVERMVKAGLGEWVGHDLHLYAYHREKMATTEKYLHRDRLTAAREVAEAMERRPPKKVVRKS